MEKWRQWRTNANSRTHTRKFNSRKKVREAASTCTWHTTRGVDVSAHVLSDKTLTIGLVPHEILSPRGGVILRLKILRAVSPLIFTSQQPDQKRTHFQQDTRKRNETKQLSIWKKGKTHKNHRRGGKESSSTVFFRPLWSWSGRKVKVLESTIRRCSLKLEKIYFELENNKIITKLINATV